MTEMKPTPSKGHICFDTLVGREFFHGPEGDLYIADSTRVIRESDGYRLGARWECMPRPDGHAHYILEVYGIDITRLASHEDGNKP